MDNAYTTKRQSFLAYAQYIPEVFRYHLVIWAFTFSSLALVQNASKKLLVMGNQNAITSGDYSFLFTTWEGWVIVLLNVAIVLVSLSLDINGLLILADKLVKNEEVRVLNIIKEAFLSIPRLFTKEGILYIVYLVLGAPITGVGLMISVTQNIYVPRFVTDVIFSNPLYLLGFALVNVAFVAFAVVNSFVLPYCILKKENVRNAFVKSYAMFKEHWKDFIVNILYLWAAVTVLSIAIVTIFNNIPGTLELKLHISAQWKRFFVILFYAMGAMVSASILTVKTPMMTVELVRLFYSYEENREVYLQKKTGKIVTKGAVWLSGIMLAIVVIFSVGVYYTFDSLVPNAKDKQLISHRLGGNAACENSVEGAEIAMAFGAEGLETDVQRTKDGVYVINHDNSFKRVCGVDRNVRDMTYDEVKELRITSRDGMVSLVPTLDEVLNVIKDRAHLYLELKGDTANTECADEIVAILKEKEMTDQVTVVSLDYEVIDYIETTYPELETGYLYFFYYGNIADLHCDLLIMEEEAASADIVDTIHNSGKKAYVWTINNAESARNFLTSNIDGIITDEVRMIQQLQDEYTHRSDLDLLKDSFKF
ncbi:MAG: glycerophosphoryl diester phosphodiesterase membrane domain-containing protein [Erysipelotrichaceae bacterium]|nr:glycerophosphoryl diester phosphodiesterase membrane domain-containing protein [Erysipelotrichaceae bacterium]